MRRFDGKRVIITGGANGIGKATVARFAAEGAADRADRRERQCLPRPPREQIAEETGATIYPFAADVSVKADDLATIQHALEKMGGVADVLVNNAGIYFEEHFEDITEARGMSIMNVDLKGTFLMTQASRAALQSEACRYHRQHGFDQWAGGRDLLFTLRRRKGRGGAAHQGAGA